MATENKTEETKNENKNQNKKNSRSSDRLFWKEYNKYEPAKQRTNRKRSCKALWLILREGEIKLN